MKTLLSLVATFIILTFNSVNAHETATTDCTTKDNQIQVGVNGMVCDFCAQALGKTFGKRDEVDTIDVDLDEGLVTVNVKNEQNISDETLKQLITDSGYEVTEIKRDCAG